MDLVVIVFVSVPAVHGVLQISQKYVCPRCTRDYRQSRTRDKRVYNSRTIPIVCTRSSPCVNLIFFAMVIRICFVRAQALKET